MSNLGGEDDGWEVVGVATGIERLSEAQGWADVLAVALAGSAVSLPSPPPNSGLRHIAVNPRGTAGLIDAPAKAGQPADVPSVGDPTPVAAGAAVLNMAVNGAVVATSLDHQNESAYMVVFEGTVDHFERCRRRVLRGR